MKELQNFQVKITLSANETFGSWREGIHDDLVLAVSLAAWWAEKHPPYFPGCIKSGGGLKIPDGVLNTDGREMERMRREL